MAVQSSPVALPTSSGLVVFARVPEWSDTGVAWTVLILANVDIAAVDIG